MSDPARPEVRLRTHAPGDMGWVVQRHGELYHASHGWDVTFEAMVAEIVANILRQFDEERERIWIAEADGRRAGCVALVRRSDDEAQLRLLIVEPDLRGLGIGKLLVSECVREARRLGYETMMLHTVRGLDAARALYEGEGFELARETPGHAWGHDHVDQEWRLTL